MVLQTVFQSGGTLVVQKPAGVASEFRGGTGVRETSAIEVVRRAHPDAQLPHRLDRLTGGLLVTCTDLPSLQWHNAAIQDRSWGPKVYVARLIGARVSVGQRRARLLAKGKRAEVGAKKGKLATLDVLASAPAPGFSGRATDVAILLRSGRYHQIRAMMAAEGSPVLGDELYGGGRGDTGPPLLTHALLGLPLPEGGTQRLRAPQLAPLGCRPVSEEIQAYLDALADDPSFLSLGEGA